MHQYDGGTKDMYSSGYLKNLVSSIASWEDDSEEEVRKQLIRVSSSSELRSLSPHNVDNTEEGQRHKPVSSRIAEVITQCDVSFVPVSASQFSTQAKVNEPQVNAPITFSNRRPVTRRLISGANRNRKEKNEPVFRRSVERNPSQKLVRTITGGAKKTTKWVEIDSAPLLTSSTEQIKVHLQDNSVPPGRKHGGCRTRSNQKPELWISVGRPPTEDKKCYVSLSSHKRHRSQSAPSSTRPWRMCSSESTDGVDESCQKVLKSAKCQTESISCGKSVSCQTKAPVTVCRSAECLPVSSPTVAMACQTSHVSFPCDVKDQAAGVSDCDLAETAKITPTQKQFDELHLSIKTLRSHLKKVLCFSVVLFFLLIVVILIEIQNYKRINSVQGTSFAPKVPPTEYPKVMAKPKVTSRPVPNKTEPLLPKVTAQPILKPTDHSKKSSKDLDVDKIIVVLQHWFRNQDSSTWTEVRRLLEAYQSKAVKEHSLLLLVTPPNNDPTSLCFLGALKRRIEGGGAKKAMLKSTEIRVFDLVEYRSDLDLYNDVQKFVGQDSMVVFFYDDIEVLKSSTLNYFSQFPKKHSSDKNMIFVFYFVSDTTDKDRLITDMHKSWDKMLPRHVVTEVISLLTKSMIFMKAENKNHLKDLCSFYIT